MNDRMFLKTTEPSSLDLSILAHFNIIALVLCSRGLRVPALSAAPVHTSAEPACSWRIFARAPRDSQWLPTSYRPVSFVIVSCASSSGSVRLFLISGGCSRPGTGGLVYSLRLIPERSAIRFQVCKLLTEPCNCIVRRSQPDCGSILGVCLARVEDKKGVSRCALLSTSGSPSAIDCES